MEKLIKEKWKGLLLIIGTLIVERGVNWILDAAPQVGYSLWETVVNIVYSIASYQSHSTIVQFLIFDFIMGLLILPFMVVKKVSKLTKRVMLSNSAKDEEANSKGTETEKTFEADPPQSPRQTDEEHLSAAKQIENRVRRIRKKVALLVVETIVVVVSWLTIISYPADLWSRFELDMITVGPYVEEQDIKQLRSDWVQMRSKDDYNKIYEYINGVKAEFDLK